MGARSSGLDISAQIYDIYTYLLQVIDVFPKYLRSVALRSKPGTTVASAFESSLLEPNYTKPLRRRALWVRKKMEKNF
jgi:hypothetical protein